MHSQAIVSVGTWWMWLLFAAIIVTMLLTDLLLFKADQSRGVSLRSAALWSAVWVVSALLFAAALWVYLDTTAGLAVANRVAIKFLTGYLVEKSLAIDNVFVWMMIFSYFAIPPKLQRRILLYGILGAVVLRTTMILGGSLLISQFEWILYLFGLFLIFLGIRMLFGNELAQDPSQSRILQWMRKHYPVTDWLVGEHFFVRINGIRHATPLLLALILVEFSDIVFAVDSIPAIFAITRDPFIVLTSNLFAILGLRAMYFLLVGFAGRFSLLKYGLGVILCFVGIKMLIAEWLEIPVHLSLAFIALTLTITIGLSLWQNTSRHSPSQKSQ